MNDQIPTKPDLLPEIKRLLAAVRRPGAQTVLMRAGHVDWLINQVEIQRELLRHIKQVAGLGVEVDVDAMLGGDTP